MPNTSSTPKSPSPRPRAAVSAHGCKLNRAEADAMARQLIDAGFDVVPQSAHADLYVLNTCSVTHVADAKGRQWFSGVHKRNPQAKVIATGCYATRAPSEVHALPGVDAVVPNNRKDRLAEAATELMAGWTRDVDAHPVAAMRDPGRSRSFVKIQDGCNQFCAFCVIPGTRGRETNLPLETVLTEVRARVSEGYREVVITGPQIGSYGQYPPTPEYRRDPLGYNRRLHGLVERILTETDLPRLRVSSIQPQDLTPRLLEAFANPRVCSHVHLALQSGSDSTLARMGRRYRTEQFRNAVDRFRQAVPEIAVTTDVMVGFPAETREEFEESYRFCQEMAFAAVHVFPYSPRPDTRAYDFQGAVPDEEKRHRMRRMLALAETSAQRFRRSFLGRNLDVLWEEKVELSGVTYVSGLTGNYIRAYSSDVHLSPNEITCSQAKREMANGLLVESAGLP